MSHTYSLEDYRLFGYFFKFFTSPISFIDRATVAYETYHSVHPESRLALVMYLLQHGREYLITEWPTKEREFWSHEDYLAWVDQHQEHVLLFLQDLRDRHLPLGEAAIEFWQMIESFAQDQESYFALGFCLLQSDFMPYEQERSDNKFVSGNRTFAKIRPGFTKGYITVDDQKQVIISLLFLTSGFQRMSEHGDETSDIAAIRVSNSDNRFLIARAGHEEDALSCHPQVAYALCSFIDVVNSSGADSQVKPMFVSLGLPMEILDALFPTSIEAFARNLREDIDISFTAHVILKRELKWGIRDILGRQFVDSVLNNRELEAIVDES